MKKMFISVIALAMGVMAMATETAYVQIKLTGETGGASNVFLTEDDAYTNAFEPGVDVEKMMSQSNSKSVLMYGFVGTTPCEDVVAANLDGLSLGFATNQVDQNYTLNFIDFEGRTLKLYDRLLNVETTITDGGSYPFSVDPSLVGRHQINDRFFINLDEDDFAYSLTTNEYGWASYSNEVEAVVALVPAGLKIYKGAINGDVLDLTVVDHVAADQGVIVKGAPSTVYYFAAGSGSSSFADNALKASSAWTSNTGNIFVLHDEALYQYTGSDMPANKAYLDLGTAPAPHRISLRVNEETAIDNVEVEAVKAEKFVQDGQILIRRGNEVFNLQGQIVK